MSTDSEPPGTLQKRTHWNTGHIHGRHVICLWIVLILWVIAESSIPSIENRPRLASAVNMMFNSTACSAFILWYLERGRARDEDRARAVATDHARTIEEVATLVYTVAFADGAAEERNNQQADDEIGDVISLDEHRPGAGHPAPRPTGNDHR